MGSSSSSSSRWWLLIAAAYPDLCTFPPLQMWGVSSLSRFHGCGESGGIHLHDRGPVQEDSGCHCLSAPRPSEWLTPTILRAVGVPQIVRL